MFTFIAKLGKKIRKKNEEVLTSHIFERECFDIENKAKQTREEICTLIRAFGEIKDHHRRKYQELGLFKIRLMEFQKIHFELSKDQKSQENELINTLSKLDSVKAVTRNLQAEIENYKKCYVDDQLELKELKMKIIENEKHDEGRKSLIAKLSDELTSTRNSLSLLREDRSCFEDQIMDLESKKHEYILQLELIRTESEYLVGQIKHLLQQSMDLEFENDAIEKELENHRYLFEIKKNELETAQIQKKLIAVSNQALLENLEQERILFSDIEIERKKEINSKAEFLNKIEHAKIEIGELKIKIPLSSQETSDLIQNNANYKLEKMALDIEVEQLRAESKRVTEEYNLNYEILQLVSTEKDFVSSEIGKLNENISTLSVQNQSYQVEIEKFEKDRNILLQTSESLQQEELHLRRDRDEVREVCKGLELQNIEIMAKYNDLNNKVDSLKLTSSQSQAFVNQLRNDITTHSTKVECLIIEEEAERLASEKSINSIEDLNNTLKQIKQATIEMKNSALLAVAKREEVAKSIAQLKDSITREATTHSNYKEQLNLETVTSKFIEGTFETLKRNHDDLMQKNLECESILKEQDMVEANIDKKIMLLKEEVVELKKSVAVKEKRIIHNNDRVATKEIYFNQLKKIKVNLEQQ